MSGRGFLLGGTLRVMAPQEITIRDISRVAELSRLALEEAALEAYREDLLQILQHVNALSNADIDDVEPMARPHDVTNRLDKDEPEPALDRDQLLELAPDVEFPFLAVPKVLEEGGA